MDRPSPTDPDAAIQQKRLQALAETFHEAWSNATSADIQRFLPPRDDPLRPAALRELIKADLNIRWQRKQPVVLEAYLKNYPELSGRLTTDLIYEEFLVRQQFGDHPSLATYQQRFPAQFAELEAMVRSAQTGLSPSGPGSTANTSRPSLPSAGSPTLTTPQPPSREAPTVVAPNLRPSSAPSQTVMGYTMIKRLGSGSFAEVWEGEAPGGFPVAIKRIIMPLEDDQAQRELQSLESISKLRHLFILQTHRTFIHENHLYVVMELADGTLRDRMKQCQKAGLAAIPLAELLNYFRESAEALDYMHSKNLIHRDIKPHNILILNCHAKIADFGLATLRDPDRMMFTATGTGTPAYMAPEVWNRKVSPRSDQYSLAATWAEQRLGRWAIQGKDLPTLMMQHLAGTPDLTGLPAAEQEVVNKALAKAPDQRYPSCVEFVQALEEALVNEQGKSNRSSRLRGNVSPTGDSTQAVPSGQAPTQPVPSATAPIPSVPSAKVSPQPRRRSRIIVLVALFVLVGVGVLGGYVFHKRPVEPLASPTTRATTTETATPIKSEVWTALLRQADQALRDSNFADLPGLLDRAETMATEQPEGVAEVEARRALYLARDPAQAGERGRAVELLKNLVARTSPPLHAELCLEWARLAESNSALRDDARAALEASIPKLKDGDKERVETALANLLALEIRGIVPSLGPKSDWRKLLEDCRRAKPTGWVLACKAECLIEAANGKPAEAQLKEALAILSATTPMYGPRGLDLLAKGKSPAEVVTVLTDAPGVEKATTAMFAYDHYARALVAAANGKPEIVTTALAEALLLDEKSSRDDNTEGVFTGRRGRIADLLIVCLRTFRVVPEPGNPLKAPFRQRQDVMLGAVCANLLLHGPKGLATKDVALTIELKQCLALAGWYGPDPKAAGLADELGRDPGWNKLGAAAPPLLLAQARSQDLGTEVGKRSALTAYLQFMERSAEAIETAGDPAIAVTCYRTVLEPAFKIDAGPDRSAPVGKLNAYLGRIIATHPDAAWPFKDARRRAVDAWNEAVRLDESNAEYRVWRGKATLQLANYKLEDVEADATKALTLNKDLPSARALHGHTLLLRSRREKVPAKRLEPARAAVREYDEAVRLGQARKDSGADLADVLAGRSTARVELANYLPGSADPKERETLLRGARDDATAASKIEDRRDPDYAWAALGNALEDMAWLLKQKELYPAAVRAFTQAINLRGDLATYWLARGRCQYRQVVFGNDDRKILESAANDLDEALKNAPRPDQKAEASFWRAKILVAGGDLKSAEKDFETATQSPSTSGWPVYVLEWASLALSEAGRQSDAKERARYLKYAQDHAEKLLAFQGTEAPLPEASRILGQVYYLKGEPKKALDQYLAGLPLNDVPKADRSHLGLLLARIDCVLVNGLNDDFIKALKPSPAEVARRDAERAVQLAADPTIADSTRGYILGVSGIANDLAANERDVDPVRRKEFRAVLFDRLTQALKLAPDHPSAWMWQGTLGTEYMNRSQFKEALPLLEEARKKASPESRGVLDSRIKTCKDKLGR